MFTKKRSSRDKLLGWCWQILQFWCLSSLLCFLSKFAPDFTQGFAYFHSGSHSQNLRWDMSCEFNFFGTLTIRFELWQPFFFSLRSNIFRASNQKTSEEHFCRHCEWNFKNLFLLDLVQNFGNTGSCFSRKVLHSIYIVCSLSN